MEHRSWLVQRLQQPRGGRAATFSEAFAFGGGLQNGGLSDEAMGLLREVWSFDYMGAAEFEFGAVPEALSKLAKASLLAHTFTIPLAEVAANWRDKSKATPDGDAPIYVLCPAGWESEIERRIRGWAADAGADDLRLKEPTKLASALRPVEDWDSDTCGWLEISNGFLFFTDEPMWRKACALFGVAVEEHAAA